MENELSKQHKTVFEQIKQVDKEGIEWWSARQLGKILEYSEYRHFKPVIEKAKEACANSEQRIEDHFEDFLEMVDIGSGAKRPTLPYKPVCRKSGKWTNTTGFHRKMKNDCFCAMK